MLFCSQKIWIYFFRIKSKASEIFKKYKAAIEDEYGTRVILIDNGEEFGANLFSDI
jgi:hypothetical protein